MANTTDHRRAEDASLALVAVGVLVVGIILTAIVTACILVKPLFTTYRMEKEPRCHRYLEFRHLTGYYDSKIQQCIAQTKTGTYILDDMYY